MYQNSKSGKKISFRVLMGKCILLIPFFAFLLLGCSFIMSGFMNGENTLIIPFASLLFNLFNMAFEFLVVAFILVLIGFVVIEGIETLNMIISDIRSKSNEISKVEKDEVPAEWKEFTQHQVKNYKEMGMLRN